MKKVFTGWVPQTETMKETLQDAGVLSALKRCFFLTEALAAEVDGKAKKRRITIIVEDVKP